jgi:hypothetical protein
MGFTFLLCLVTARDETFGSKRSERYEDQVSGGSDSLEGFE